MDKNMLEAYLSGHAFSYAANAVSRALKKTLEQKQIKSRTRKRAAKSNLKRAKQPSPIKQGVYEPSSALVREFAERGCEAKLLPVSVDDTGTFFRVGAKDKRFHLTANMALDILNTFLKGYKNGKSNGYVSLPQVIDPETKRQKTLKWMSRFPSKVRGDMKELGCVYQPKMEKNGAPTKYGRMIFVDDPRKL